MVSLTLFYSFVACAFLMVSSKEAICRFLPKRVVKDFLIKFTKRPQKKCQKHFHAPDTQASRVTCGRLAVRRKGTHIPAVGRYRVSSAA